MRATALVCTMVILASAGHAAAGPLIERTWRTPLPLPMPVDRLRDRPMSSPIIIAPTTPQRQQPTVTTPQGLADLQRRAETATGVARIAAIDVLLASLADQDFDAVPDFDALMQEIAVRSRALLAEPALESYPYADELIYRAGRALTRDEPAARKAFARLIEKFPASPFAVDAKLALGVIAEEARRYAEAKRYFAEVAGSKRAPIADYGRLRLGWAMHLAGDHAGAVRELTHLALEGDRQLRGAAIDTIIWPYARAGRPELARALFDRVDNHRTLDLLRTLAGEYAEARKHAEAIVVLRATLALDGSHAAGCLDRADIVASMIGAKNRSDAEVAIAELVEALPFATPACASAADEAVGALAEAWHRSLGKGAAAPQARAQVIRIWDRVIALATTPQRKALASHNRLSLVWQQGRGDRRAATWIAIAEAARDAAGGSPGRSDLSEATLDAWENAIRLAPDATERAQIRAGLVLAEVHEDRIRKLLARVTP